jgi:hypothetical protein
MDEAEIRTELIDPALKTTGCRKSFLFTPLGFLS